MREMGLEPTRPCSHKNLNLARLPIPTFPRIPHVFRMNNRPRFHIVSALNGCGVQKMGLEPTRPCGHRHLKPARLPIPPLLQANRILTQHPICVNIQFYKNICSTDSDRIRRTGSVLYKNQHFTSRSVMDPERMRGAPDAGRKNVSPRRISLLRHPHSISPPPSVQMRTWKEVSSV